MSDANKPDSTPGTFAWNELITRDADASADFYTQLFGWTAAKMPMPNGSTYTMFKIGERPVAGMMVPPAEAEGAPEMWMSYINVADLDVAVAKAKELGATICMERVDTPMGSFGVVRDPRGVTFAFWQCAPNCPPAE